MFLALILGTIFGFVLSRSGAADYDFIQGMFLFTNLQLYGIIGTAVVLTAPGLWLLKRYGRTATGGPLRIDWREDGEIVMTGAAAESFRGSFDPADYGASV